MAASILYCCGYFFLLWKGAQNDAHCNCIKAPYEESFRNNCPTYYKYKTKKFTVKLQFVIYKDLWARWCDKQQIDAFQCDVIKVLDYLAFLLEKLYEYRTIGCHRSAMSAFYDFVDGKPVGQHPEACALVSGIFNNRPTPQPRYVFAWNVESVINHIKTKWKNNENLSEKCLVILMALTSASRASGMHCLYVRFMIKSEDDYFFIFHKLQSKAQPKLYFNKKPKDLCLVFP